MERLRLVVAQLPIAHAWRVVNLLPHATPKVNTRGADGSNAQL